MKLNVIFWIIPGNILSYLLIPSLTVSAQIIPDNTLRVNTVVTSQNNITVIEGGTVRNGNLFHSFNQFSVSKDNIAFFRATPNIQNIFGRVTGSSISNIDGILKADGTANLFLINPNGLIFGRNARLEIGGSFFASTANAINFADGVNFNAKDISNKPLLTISHPIGLQFGNNSGGIQVQGTGQGLTNPSSITSPTTRNSDVTGLRVVTGKTLALIGNNITLDGATLTADGGRVELGSIAGNGIVGINSLSQGWNLDYKEVSSFSDIILLRKALIDASGNRGGDVYLKGRNISLESGATILIQNQHSSVWGDINVNALDSVTLDGESPNGKFLSLLRTESLGSGSGGNINIFTGKLIAQRGGVISNRNYSNGQGGNINVSAFDSVILLEASSINPLIISGILTSALASGKAGDITVSARRVEAHDGGGISSTSLKKGDGGNVVINAFDSVEVNNSSQLINSESDFIPSAISTVAFSEGNAGNLTINAQKMFVGEKSSVNTSSVGSGSAGYVTINVPNLKLSGNISSAVVVANEYTQALFKAPSIPSGNPGQVTINTNDFSLSGGIVSVRNLGSGSGGTVMINGRSISLKNKATVTATTASGQGGDIIIQSQNLLLRDNSSITTNAGLKSGQGNGGNININAEILAILENSSITANAFEGRGGNIRINAQGLLLSSDSEIRASSQRGIDGKVQINTSERYLNQIPIPSESVSATPETTSVCQGRSNSTVAENKFVITGTSGLPPSPDDIPDTNLTWYDNSIPIQPNNDLEPIKSTTSPGTGKIVEAQGWIKTADGTIILTAEPTTVTSSVSSSAPAPSCKLSPTQVSATETAP